MSGVDLTGKKVLVTLPVNDDERTAFEQAIEGAGAEVAFIREPFVRDKDTADVAVIIGNVPVRTLHAPEALLWLQTSSAGYDHYLASNALGPKTLLSSAAGTYGQAVSEHMFAQLLCLMKKLHLYRDNQRRATWHDEGTASTPCGASVLVIGAGDIGTHFAQLCANMGARVTGLRRTKVDAESPYERMVTMDQLFEMLPQADVVASVLPSTPETRSLADKSFFAAMHRGSYFINAGRGDLVVSEDLLEALQTGHLAGAALEVTNPEPLPPDHPLWAEPKVLITPHISGFWHLPAQTRTTVSFCLENLKAFLAGENVRNLVAR